MGSYFIMYRRVNIRLSNVIQIYAGSGEVAFKIQSKKYDVLLTVDQ